MATCNFREQDGFPLFATCLFDGYSYEDEDECGFVPFDEWHFDYCKGKCDELNESLKYYKITLESGYYEGVQVVLEEAEDGCGSRWAKLTKDYTAGEWAEERRFEKEYYGYYCEFDLPYAERKKAEQREIERIIEFCRTVLKNDFAFDEYVCTARFSNGEARYEQASNVRARIKALAVA